MSITVLPPLSKVTVEVTDSAANSWCRAKLGGLSTPGTIPVGGLKGFRRKTGWDVKAGKGTKGATLTLQDQPPVRGTVTVQLITPQDFRDWDDFAENVLSIDPSDQQAEGLSWYYPGHASIALSAVVVEEYSGIEYAGKGKYHATFDVIEWQPPPDASIVRTVAATAADTHDNVGGSDLTVPGAQDPRIVAKLAEIAARKAAST